MSNAMSGDVLPQSVTELDPFGSELMVSVETAAGLGELACVMGGTSSNDDWGVSDPAEDPEKFQPEHWNPEGTAGSVASLN